MVKRIFNIADNNKGLRCPFKPILCQEGYCEGCQIYLDWQKLGELLRICSWCGKVMGKKDGHGQSGITHGMCPECCRNQTGAAGRRSSGISAGCPGEGA